MGTWGITMRKSDYGLDLLGTIVDTRLKTVDFLSFHVADALELIKNLLLLPYGKKAQIIEGIQTVGLCRLYHRVDDGAGLRSLWCIVEQPVFPAHYKGPDGVFRRVVGDIHLAAVEKSVQILLLVSGIAHRILQLAARRRVQLFHTRPIRVK